MSPDSLVELVASGLAVWATLLSIPRPPKLEWERLFKVVLSVLVAGQVEAELGAVDAAARDEWAARVLGKVTWNPLGRLAERKLRAADLDDVPVPALDGERALVQALGDLADPVARFNRLYRDDPRAKDELLGDPLDLGEQHDPARILGPDAGWDQVAAWTPRLQALLARRMADVVFVLDGLADPLATRILEAWPGLRAVVLPPYSLDPTAESSVEALFDAVEGVLLRGSDRVVMVSAGLATQRSLAALAEGGGLRDRCLAVVALGGQIQTEEFAPWLDQHFNHDSLDTELKRSVPYLSVVDIDPADPVAQAWSRQRFPVPVPLKTGRAPVDVVDLGPLVLAEIHPRELARGLLLLLALRTAG
ncbi:MAG: hypothetical protein GXP62_16535 [Oligoflexia bacterium]|nr:hypothetical protein [Oligoflexia bacterium]